MIIDWLDDSAHEDADEEGGDNDASSEHGALMGEDVRVDVPTATPVKTPTPALPLATPPTRSSWMDRAREWMDPTGGWMKDPESLLAQFSAWVDPAGHKAASEEAAPSNDATPEHQVGDTEPLRADAHTKAPPTATPKAHRAPMARPLRCALAPDSAVELAWVVANPAPRARPAPRDNDLAANMRSNNHARFGGWSDDDDSDEDAPNSSEGDAGSVEELVVVAPPHGCAPVDAGVAVVRVLELALGYGGNFRKPLARRAIGLMDLLHRDLVAVPLPTALNARRRFEAQLSVSVLMLARSARAVRSLVLKSGELEEQQFNDSDDDDGVPWHTVGPELLIPPAPPWIALALATPALAAAKKTQHRAQREQPSRNAAAMPPTPRPAPTHDDDHGSGQATTFYGKLAPARGSAPDVQGCSVRYFAPSTTADPAGVLIAQPTAVHGDNDRIDGGAKPTLSGGTNAGTKGAGTN